MIRDIVSMNFYFFKGGLIASDEITEVVTMRAVKHF